MGKAREKKSKGAGPNSKKKKKRKGKEKRGLPFYDQRKQYHHTNEINNARDQRPKRDTKTAHIQTKNNLLDKKVYRLKKRFGERNNASKVIEKVKKKI